MDFVTDLFEELAMCPHIRGLNIMCRYRSIQCHLKSPDSGLKGPQNRIGQSGERQVTEASWIPYSIVNMAHYAPNLQYMVIKSQV